MCELVALPSCKAPEKGFRSVRSLARLTVLGEAWLAAEEGAGYAESVVAPSVSARGVEKELTVGQMKEGSKGSDHAHLALWALELARGLSHTHRYTDVHPWLRPPWTSRDSFVLLQTPWIRGFAVPFCKPRGVSGRRSRVV